MSVYLIVTKHSGVYSISAICFTKQGALKCVEQEQMNLTNTNIFIEEIELKG